MTYHPYYPPQRPMYPPVYRPPVPPPPPRRPNVAKVVAIVAMVVLAVVGIVVTLVAAQDGSTTTASGTGGTTTEITCPPGFVDPRDGECGFLYSMKSNGYGSLAPPQAEIGYAHQACTAIDQGTKLSGLHVIFKSYPGVSGSDAGQILGVGVSAYCPWAVNAPDH